MRIGIDATCWSNQRGFGCFIRELLRAIARRGTADAYVLFTDRQTVHEAPILRYYLAHAEHYVRSVDAGRATDVLWIGGVRQ